MKLLTLKELREEREKRMLKRASFIIGRLKNNPDYFERVHLLVLVDILDLFIRNKLPSKEAQIVAQSVQSERVQQLIDRLLDVTLWMRTKEGQSWVKKIEEKSLSI